MDKAGHFEAALSHPTQYNDLQWHDEYVVKMSSLIHPKSRIFVQDSSFCQISSNHWKVFYLQTDKFVLISKSVEKCSISLYYSKTYSVHWKVGLLLMSALIFHWATSVFRDTRNILSKTSFFVRRKSLVFCPKCRPKLWISFSRPKCWISRFRSFFVWDEFVVSLMLIYSATLSHHFPLTEHFVGSCPVLRYLQYSCIYRR